MIGKSMEQKSEDKLESRQKGVRSLPATVSSRSLQHKESKRVLECLTAAWVGGWSRPLSAEELLEIGREGLEPLFHEPPIGPIPDYLEPHSSVYGCVAEYEDKLEEIDRWKACALDSWLKEKAGQRYLVGEEVYMLHSARCEATGRCSYWLEKIGARKREES